MHFSVEEFHIMVQELLYTEPSRSDMLCEIVQRTLEPMVAAWCEKDPILRGRGLEGDIMQGIQLRLMKKTIPNFLLNDRVEGPYNDDPEGFEHWIVTVGHNYQRDFANRLRQEEFRTGDVETLETVAVHDEDWITRQDRQMVLRNAFRAVLDSDMRVYKVLTWWAHVLFIAEQSLEHHKANQLIVTMFENKTLREMYDYVLAASRNFPWMTLTRQQHENVLAALQKPWDDTHTYGDMPYHTFYMKYRGEYSGNKSVSDWINRVNDWVRLRCDEECPTTKSATGTKKEGRG